MKKTALKVLKFLGFLSIGLGIFYYLYFMKTKYEERQEIIETLKTGVNYFWILVSLLIGLLSHISRTARWRIMIEPIGHKPRFINTFLSVMVGYLMNLVIPRMGEVSRCGVLTRYEKISFSKSFGTVVAERLIDLISLLILLGIVIITQFGKMMHFYQQNPEIQQKIISIFKSPYLIIGFLGLLLLIVLFRNTIKKSSITKKIKEILTNFKEGFISIRSIKQKGWFYFHSVFIWLMYYLMFYVVFFAFDFTKGLGPIAGLTTFVLASFGMVAPVQGGIGAWHFMATEALWLYGVERLQGKTFALLAWSLTNGMIILIGVISLLILPFINRRKDVDEQESYL